MATSQASGKKFEGEMANRETFHSLQSYRAFYYPLFLEALYNTIT